LPPRPILAGGARRRDPVSLKAETGIDIAPEAFLDHLAPAFDRIERQFATYGFAPIRTAWLQGAARLGETITARLPGEEVTGRLSRRRPNGNLVMETPSGRRASPPPRFSFKRTAIKARTLDRRDGHAAVHRLRKHQHRLQRLGRDAVPLHAPHRDRTSADGGPVLRLVLHADGASRAERADHECIISSTVPRVVFNLRVLCDRYFDTRPYVVGKPECLLPEAAARGSGHAGGPRPAGEHRRRLSTGTAAT
jgi:hypothetical protein